MNTSPKSVLDCVEGACASYASVACIENCDINVSCKIRDEGVEVNEARDAAAGNTEQLLHRLNQDELGSKDSIDHRLMDNSSKPLGASNFCDVTSSNKEKISIASTLGVHNCKIDEIKDDGFHPLTPPGSPSLEKVSLKSPGKADKLLEKLLMHLFTLNFLLELINEVT